MGEEVGGVRNRWVRKAEIKICDVCCPGGGGGWGANGVHVIPVPRMGSEGMWGRSRSW